MGLLLSLLLPAIPSLIQIVEKLFGPKTGAAKMDTVLDIVKKLITNIQLPTGTTSASITDDQIKAAIETVLAGLKSTGQIDNPLPTIGAGSVLSDIWIGRGSFTKVTF